MTAVARTIRILGAALALLALSASVAAAAAAGPLPPVKHVFIIVLENKSFDETFGKLSAAPYLSQTLPSKGVFIPNYFGVTHASLGNYVALISGQGSNLATQTDCQIYMNLVPGTIQADGQALGQGCVYPPAVKTVADQLTAAGLTWKGYMEDMGNAAGQPSTCRRPALSTLDKTQVARAGDQYAARHNPFVYFHSLIDSGACPRYDVPLTQLPGDLASASTTPSYAFITPNLCNDGHDASCVGSSLPGGLAGVDRFLRAWVPRILSSPAYTSGGLLAITFDESNGGDSGACCNESQFPNTPNNGGTSLGRGGGRTGAVLLSPFIDPGSIDHTPYNHFTLLRSIEDLFGLVHLGYAGSPGQQSLGPQTFTCYAAGRPKPRHGSLPRGALIKLVRIGQGARRPTVEIKLWHAGSALVQVRRPKAHPRRSVGRPRRLSPCQLLKLGLPYKHGSVTVSARAFGGVERRTLSF